MKQRHSEKKRQEKETRDGEREKEKREKRKWFHANKRESPGCQKLSLAWALRYLSSREMTCHISRKNLTEENSTHVLHTVHSFGKKQLRKQSREKEKERKIRVKVLLVVAK